jgi:hypothetical protein
MAFKNYREESKGQWGQDTETLTIEQLTMGCMLRIADAVELMAKNHAELIRDRDRAVSSEKCWREEAHGIARSNNALRGVITKLKNRK